MKVLFYSSKDFELPYLNAVASPDMIFHFTPLALSPHTCSLAEGYDAISIFSSDDASTESLHLLRDAGIRFIAVRAAGYDNVNLSGANGAGIKVANVPEFSPNAIAEHAVAMILALNRKLVLANEQVHQQNFTLNNLIGFDLNKKKVGIIGTGRIGRKVARIMHGFGCSLFAYDIKRDDILEQKYNVFYTGLNTICNLCDIITIHLPLNNQTRYLIDRNLIQTMKRGVMLINTARGAIINTADVIDALRIGQVGHLGMDVYENEKGIFFHDHGKDGSTDPMLNTLMDFPNVLITPHQGFATNEALSNIAHTTFHNLLAWKKGNNVENEITNIEIMNYEYPIKSVILFKNRRG